MLSALIVVLSSIVTIHSTTNLTVRETLAAVQTVPVPPPVFKGCNPPADLCATMEADCLEAGLDPERCEVIASGICPGSACMALSTVTRDCTEAGLDCADLVKRTNANLVGCSCELHCEDTDTLSLESLFAVCFAYPSATGDDCSEPSSGQCMALLTLSDRYCDITTCEWVACQRDLIALGSVCDETPASCDKIVACDEAEDGS